MRAVWLADAVCSFFISIDFVNMECCSLTSCWSLSRSSSSLSLSLVILYLDCIRRHLPYHCWYRWWRMDGKIDETLETGIYRKRWRCYQRKVGIVSLKWNWKRRRAGSSGVRQNLERRGFEFMFVGWDREKKTSEFAAKTDRMEYETCLLYVPIVFSVCVFSVRPSRIYILPLAFSM